MEAALQQLREIEEASRGSIVYIRGRATVHAKAGTNLFSRLVRWLFSVYEIAPRV